MKDFCWMIFAVLLVPAQFCQAVTVKTIDESGAAIANVLVLVCPLDSQYQCSQRFLTDPKGRTPVFELSPGLYQFIATYPHGYWRDSVSENYVDVSTKQIVVQVRAEPVIDALQSGESKRQVRVRLVAAAPPHVPLAGSRVLVRDIGAINEHWLHTDARGTVAIDLVDGPTILVVPIQGQVHTYVLVDDCQAPHLRSDSLFDAACISVRSPSVEIDIP